MDTTRSNSVTFAEFRKGWQSVGLHLVPNDYRLLFDRVFDRDRGTNRVRWVDMKLALAKFKLKSPRNCSPRQRSSLLAAARSYDRDIARTAVHISKLDTASSLAANFISAHSPTKPKVEPEQARPVQHIPEPVVHAPKDNPAPRAPMPPEQEVWSQRVGFLMRINSMRVGASYCSEPSSARGVVSNLSQSAAEQSMTESCLLRCRCCPSAFWRKCPAAIWSVHGTVSERA